MYFKICSHDVQIINILESPKMGTIASLIFAGLNRLNAFPKLAVIGAKIIRKINNTFSYYFILSL